MVKYVLDGEDEVWLIVLQLGSGLELKPVPNQFDEFFSSHERQREIQQVCAHRKRKRKREGGREEGRRRRGGRGRREEEG